MMLSNLMITYLFLGGAGAGALFILIIVDVLTSRSVGGKNSRWFMPLVAFRPLFTFGYLLSGGVLASGALCLLSDLGRPDRLLLLFLRPTLSYLTLGTYALAVVIICAFVLALAWSGVGIGIPQLLLRVLSIIGLVAAFVTIAYTGLLFQSIGVGTLLDTILLPTVFVISSFSTGIALLLTLAAFTRAGELFSRFFKRLIRADTLVVILEAVVIGALILMSFKNQHMQETAKTLVSGEYALLFWIGAIGCGIFVPLVFEGIQHLSRRGVFGLMSIPRNRHRNATGSQLSIAVAIPLFVGGYCLRFTLLSAGLTVLSTSTLGVP